MSESNSKRVVVWVQQFTDREHFVLQWHDPATGKRKSRSAQTADPKKADDARADLEYELNNGLHKEGSRMNWEKFRELFEAEFVTARRQNTRENYKAMMDIFERTCTPQALRSVTTRTVSQFAAALRREPGKGTVGQAPSTIRQRLQLLKTALAWAVKQKLLAEMPEFPSVKVPKKNPQPVPTELFERLVARAPDDQLKAFLLAGWLGGLRLVEAFSLEREPSEKAPYLDLAADRIIFPAEFVKGCADQWIPLDPELKAALLALPSDDGRGARVFRFTTQRGRPVGLSAVGERIIRLAKKAGVKLTMRTLRRGFGSRYAGKVPAQVLQKLMRHSNIALTMAYYANVDDAVMEAVLGAQRNGSRNSDRPATRQDKDSTTQPQPEKQD